jgi:hypothetical protein
MLMYQAEGQGQVKAAAPPPLTGKINIVVNPAMLFTDQENI